MTQGESERVHARPISPPTEPAEMPVYRRRSSWPTVIGVIAIIFGALGVLGAVWSAIAPAFMGSMMAAMPHDQFASMESMKDFNSWMAPFSVLGGGLGALLVVAGIGLLKHRPWARTLCMAWAGLKIVLVLVSSVLGSYMMFRLFSAMASRQDTNVPALGPGMTAVFFVFGLCLGLVWGWALPVFVLIWMSREKIKTEVGAWT
jgi:hypothetical protein